MLRKVSKVGLVSSIVKAFLLSYLIYYIVAATNIFPSWISITTHEQAHIPAVTIFLLSLASSLFAKPLATLFSIAQKVFLGGYAMFVLSTTTVSAQYNNLLVMFSVGASAVIVPVISFMILADVASIVEGEHDIVEP